MIVPQSKLDPRIVATIEEMVQAEGFECVDVQSRLESGRRILRIILDSPQGVLLDECARVSRKISPVLDGFEDLPGKYVLEVSSPGVNRPLTKPEHFRRFLGSEAKIRLHEAPEGAGRSLTGKLAALEGELLSVETRSGTRQIELSNVAKAHLHVDMDALLKQKNRR